MWDRLFNGIFSSTVTTISPLQFLLCLGTALILGGVIALLYRSQSRCSFGFSMTLFLLPAIVCVVILMVNGNLGAGVAVAGAFSLVRFRSVPGTAKEIVMLFLAMATGLACGMGFLGYAALFTVIVSVIQLVCERVALRKPRECDKLLRVTIPEDLDYGNVFDDLFAAYTVSHRLVKVKTVGLGSMFRLTYAVTLKDAVCEKPFIDALRCRNGNLEISCSLCEAEDTGGIL